MKGWGEYRRKGAGAGVACKNCVYYKPGGWLRADKCLYDSHLSYDYRTGKAKPLYRTAEIKNEYCDCADFKRRGVVPGALQPVYSRMLKPGERIVPRGERWLAMASIFGSYQVLSRAIKMLESGPLEGGSNCSLWCPWCTIADAKGLLDTEHGTGGLTSEMALEAFGLRPVTEYKNDAPLVGAREALAPYASTYFEAHNQKRSLEILREARDGLLERSTT